MAVSKQAGKAPVAPASTTAPARPANALALAMAARAKATQVAGATGAKTAAKPKPAEVRPPETSKTAKPETPKPPKEKQPEKAKPAREKRVAEPAAKPVAKPKETAKPETPKPRTSRAEPAKTGRAKPSRKAREPVEEPQPKEAAKPPASKPKAEPRTRKKTAAEPARNIAKVGIGTGYDSLESPSADDLFTVRDEPSATTPAASDGTGATDIDLSGIDLSDLLGESPARTEPARTIALDEDGEKIAGKYYNGDAGFDTSTSLLLAPIGPEGGRVELPANARPEPSLGDANEAAATNRAGIPADLMRHWHIDVTRFATSARGTLRNKWKLNTRTTRNIAFGGLAVLASIELAAAAYINPIISGTISTVLLATGLTIKYGGRIPAGIKTALENRRKARAIAARLKEAKDAPIRRIIELARTIEGIEKASEQTVRLVAEATFKTLADRDREIGIDYRISNMYSSSMNAHLRLAALFDAFAAGNAELVKETFVQEATRLAGERRAQQTTAAAA